jgi:hypothetical protein
MRVRVSGSAQSLPVVPWIAVLDPDVTLTAKEGLYVVYLYSRDLSYVYLSMNQGATQHKEDCLKRGLKNSAAEKVALSVLRADSDLLRRHLGKDTLAGLSSNIDLGAPGYFLPRGYEEGNIAALTYDMSQLPTEAILRNDLTRFLTLYQTCVEIIREEQYQFSIPAVTEKAKPKFRPKPPAFRPENLAGYRAHVGEQDQERRHRHKDLLDLFVRWIEAASLTPANNVHPCDLTVDSADIHWLVEAKTVGPNAEEAVRAAIGQLFSYRHFCYRKLDRPDPALVALFSEPVGEAFEELVVSLNIEAIWRRGEDWDGRAPDRNSSLFARAQRYGR